MAQPLPAMPLARSDAIAAKIEHAADACEFLADVAGVQEVVMTAEALALRETAESSKPRLELLLPVSLPRASRLLRAERSVGGGVADAPPGR